MKVNNIKFYSKILALIIFGMVSSYSSDTLWTQTFGGTNIDVGYCVQQTSDSGFIVTGYTRSFGTMSGRNVWLIKTNQFGNLIWQKTFGGSGDEEGNAVQQTNDGGFIIAGYTKSMGAGLNDIYLVKTDSFGNQQWAKTFGGSQDEEAYSIQQTLDGGFIIAGATSSFGSGSRDVWLIKTDFSGNEVWKKTLGGMSSDGARFVQQTSDGGYIITGWTYSQGPGAVGNVLLIKTDSSGNQVWFKAFGGSDVDRGYCVQQITNGFILTGYTASSGAGLDDMLLIKTDNSGNSIWEKTFGGSGRDYGNSIQITQDEGYIIAGYSLSYGAGSEDVWIVKTDSAGNQQWSKTFGGSASDVGYFINKAFSGGYILTGHTLSFGAGVHDVWLIRLANVIPVELVNFNFKYLNKNILLEWSTASEKNNYGFEVERRSNSNAFNKIAFLKGEGTTSEQKKYSFLDEDVKPGKYFYRLKQINYDGTFEYSKEIEVEVGMPIHFSLEQNYPNPFNPTTWIQYSIPTTSHVILKVFDILGNEVASLVNEEKSAGSFSFEFDGTSLACGVYYYQLLVGSVSYTKKMILLK
jgi:hypothetical protein